MRVQYSKRVLCRVQGIHSGIAFSCVPYIIYVVPMIRCYWLTWCEIQVLSWTLLASAGNACVYSIFQRLGTTCKSLLVERGHTYVLLTKKHNWWWVQYPKRVLCRVQGIHSGIAFSCVLYIIMWCSWSATIGWLGVKSRFYPGLSLFSLASSLVLNTIWDWAPHASHYGKKGTHHAYSSLKLASLTSC